MANILLIGKYSVIEPLGIMFLASALKEDGHDVSIHLIEDENGLFFDKVYEGKFDFVGFSIYTGFHKTMLKKAKILKNDFKVIVGGPHATFFGKECLDFANYVVVGEGLRSIRNICSGKMSEGLVFLPYLVRNDYIPIPDREVLYQDKRFANNRIKNVICTFGCPFRCSYCYADSYKRLYSDFKVRLRPVESIIDECMDIIKYPTELIYFQDDVFGFDMDWLKTFANWYRRRVPIPFHCQIRPELATEDRLKLFKEAGCHGITMAIESSNENVRETLLNRFMKNETIRNACALIKEFGFKLRTEQMLGLPNTTFEDELDLLKMNVCLQPNIAWSSIFTPYLGTRLGDWCKEQGIYDGNNDDLSDTFFSNSRLKFGYDRLRKTNMLQKIFSTCARMPDGHVLAEKFVEGEHTFENWFGCSKKHLFDNDLYRVQ